jgi:nuclear pore complex protein Nup160
MHQRARKLATLAFEPLNFVPMAELQMEAYLGAANALSLVDQKVAWIAIPLVAGPDYIVRRLL